VHRLEDLAIKSGNDDLLTNPDFMTIFRAHDRVACDDKTGLYRYKVTSSAKLLRALNEKPARL
jgi:hypothetical protein